MKVAALLLVLVGTASGFSLQQPSLARRSVARAQQQATLLRSIRMEEPAGEPAVTAPATEVDFTPKPVETQEEGGFEFDPSKYSITISIAILFVVVKAFAYFGLVDFDD